MLNAKYGKVWGTTQEVFHLANQIEVHRIEIAKGGYSSKHTHNTKYNAFYCEKGTIDIVSWIDGMEHVTRLYDHEMTTVKAGVKHKFIARSNSIVFELYYSIMEPNDIQREDHGGVLRK